MEKELFAPGMKPSNSEEIEKVAKEAEKVLKEKYSDYVTGQQKPNDKSIEITKKEVKPEDLDKAIDEAVEVLEKKKGA